MSDTPDFDIEDDGEGFTQVTSTQVDALEQSLEEPKKGVFKDAADYEEFEDELGLKITPEQIIDNGDMSAILTEEQLAKLKRQAEVRKLYPNLTAVGKGPPKGYKKKTKIDPFEAVKKLESLGFDPISETVKQIDRVDAQIAFELRKTRPSGAVIAALEATRLKAVESLQRYAYARVPETVQVNNDVVKPIEITLTGINIEDSTS